MILMLHNFLLLVCDFDEFLVTSIEFPRVTVLVCMKLKGCLFVINYRCEVKYYLV